MKNNNEEILVIPNPIYDVVFRYLMEDYETAKLVLSTLIGKKIIDLQFEPQTFTRKVEKNKLDQEITLFHLDFSATIELSDGKKETVLIELQKAKIPSDIFRFKRYLAQNFQKSLIKQVTDPETGEVREIEVSCRIFPIYIFNFKIEAEIKDLILQVNRQRRGLFTEKTLKKENDFIESISYDVLIVQLPYISKVKESDYANDEYKEKLYHLLKLFDQSQQMENRHRLMIVRKLFPGYLDRVIQRLQLADSQDPKLEDDMFVEDNYLKTLREKDNKNIILQEKLEKKEQQLEENKQQLEENKQQLEENKQQLKENKQQLLDSAKAMKESGIDLRKIQEITKLTKSEIDPL